eukprot:Em0009g223a
MFYGSTSGGGEAGLEAAVSLGAVIQLAPPVQLPPTCPPLEVLMSPASNFDEEGQQGNTQGAVQDTGIDDGDESGTEDQPMFDNIPDASMQQLLGTGTTIPEDDATNPLIAHGLKWTLEECISMDVCRDQPKNTIINFPNGVVPDSGNFYSIWKLLFPYDIMPDCVQNTSLLLEKGELPPTTSTEMEKVDEVQVYEFQESGYLFNEKPQPEVLDSESDSESDLTDVELETAVDNEEDSQISHSASFFPFPSKMFARLYFHLHSPRPMGETNLHFMWTTLKDARVEVPSLHQVKNFKLPDFVPPIRQLVSGTESYIPDCVEIMIAVPISAVHGLAEKPTELIKWDEAAHCFIWLSSEDAYNYLKPNDLKTKAAGKKDMTECVSQQLKQLELDGIEVYDSYYKESVLVIAPLLCIICDNPRASQLLNHLGGSAKKFCRFCMADRDATPQLICEERTREKSLQQIRDIQSQLTAKSKSEKSTEVFYIAYCCHFEPSQAEQLRHICQEFVDNCIAHMPELARKQKTHHLLHLVDSMLDYGPSSAFSAERCESFNSMVRLQNIFGNKLSPSRDIANHFACVEHIRFICEGGLFNNNEQCGSGLCELYKTKAVQHFFNSISIKDLNCSKRIYQPGCGRKVSTKVPLESVRVDTQDLSSTTLSQPSL